MPEGDGKTAMTWVPYIIALIFLVIFLIFIRWEGVPLTVNITEFAGLLAPLAFGAAVVERAVEIIISPLRDPGANPLKNEVARLTALPSFYGQDLLIKNATDKWNDYQGVTQKYAFAISITLSFFVAIAGIRAFHPFLDLAKFHNKTVVSDAHQLFFITMDVGISAALLAGGADGIHSVMSAVTRFFDNTNKTG
jgi:hypothetical protein